MVKLELKSEAKSYNKTRRSPVVHHPSTYFVCPLRFVVEIVDRLIRVRIAIRVVKVEPRRTDCPVVLSYDSWQV